MVTCLAMKNRLFLSHQHLDQWISDGVAEVAGDVLFFPANGKRFALKTGVLFLREVSGAGDPESLCGTVKDLSQIAAMGGDYAVESVLLGDHAFDVLEGFVADPLFDGASEVKNVPNQAEHAFLASLVRT